MNKSKKTYYNHQELLESEKGWLFYDTALKAWKAINKNISGKSVLDIGCGSGIMMGLIKLFNPNLDLTGFEGNDCYQDIWMKRGLEVVSGNIYDLPYKDNSFDTVYSSHVIEHLENPLPALSEMKRIARRRVITVVPDGDVSDKNHGSPHLHIFNRINILDIHNKLEMEYKDCFGIPDTHINQLVVIYDKL